MNSAQFTTSSLFHAFKPAELSVSITRKSRCHIVEWFEQKDRGHRRPTPQALRVGPAARSRTSEMQYQRTKSFVLSTLQYPHYLIFQTKGTHMDMTSKYLRSQGNSIRTSPLLGHAFLKRRSPSWRPPQMQLQGPRILSNTKRDSLPGAQVLLVVLNRTTAFWQNEYHLSLGTSPP